MGVGVNLTFNPITMLVTIINLAMVGVGIYLLILGIKALRVYIKKNSK